jgi:putative transposase
MYASMARVARLVIPDIPHHVTQRGNGRAPTFFSDDDYGLYRALLAETARRPAWPCGPGC